jgi:hypothetical protein
MTKPKLTRDQKARLLFNGGVRPTETGKDTWAVRAASGPLTYQVRRDDGLFSCTCPDFASRGDPCKHILLVQFAIAQVEDPRQARKCDRCIEAWHNRAASYSAGFHMWCGHSRALVEPEKKKACEWFTDRSELIIV